LQVRWIAIAAAVLCGAAQAQNGESGVASFQAHRYADARRSLEAAATSDANNAKAHLYLGRIALHQTRFDDAIVHLEKAVALEPGVAAHHAWLGRAYGQLAVRSGLRKKFSLAKRSRAALERAVELDPSNLEARSWLTQFYLLAPRIVGGSASKARAQANELAKLSEFRGALARAWIAEDRGKHDEAAREYRAAIARQPDSLIAYWGLAQLWHRAEQFDSAFVLLDGLIARHPEAMPAYYYYGRGSSLSGQKLPEGERALLRYVAYTPHEGEPPLSSAHYRLGWVYERMGTRDAARREYERSLRLEPTRNEVREALARVR
jgi:tetratricopeptide (TPR) repeat protein